MRTKSGSVASGCGRERLQAALAGGGTGAPGRPRVGARGIRSQPLVERQAREAVCIAGLEEMMQKVRSLGRYPKEGLTRSPAEQQLAETLRRTRTAKQFSPEQEAELEALQQAERRKNRGETGAKLMRQVRDLGRYPKESTNRSLAERRLAEKLRRARKAKKFSPEQEAELKALQQAEKDAKVAADIAEARDKPNPNEGFADEAHNKIDQDLMMLENGIRTRDLLRRLDKYKVLVSSPSAQHEEFAEEYAERVREALAMSAGKSRR